MDGTPTNGTFMAKWVLGQWFSEVFLSPCRIIETIIASWLFLNTASHESPKIAGIQYWFLALILPQRYFSRSFESLDGTLPYKSNWWDIQSLFNYCASLRYPFFIPSDISDLLSVSFISCIMSLQTCLFNTFSSQMELIFVTKWSLLISFQCSAVKRFMFSLHRLIYYKCKKQSLTNRSSSEKLLCAGRGVKLATSFSFYQILISRGLRVKSCFSRRSFSTLLAPRLICGFITVYKTYFNRIVAFLQDPNCGFLL